MRIELLKAWTLSEDDMEQNILTDLQLTYCISEK